MNQKADNPGQLRRSGGPTLRHVGVVLGLVFAVTLAVIIGKQMSTEAMAVVIGVVCGIAAGIPTSVLLLVVLTRRERQQEERARQKRQGGYSPVVIIRSGMPHTLPTSIPDGSYWLSATSEPPVRREFHVVGGDDLRLDDRTH